MSTSSTSTSPFILLPAPVTRSTAPAANSDEAALRETLKRCPPSTLEAALAYRRTSDPVHVPAIVLGLIARFVEPAHRDRLLAASPSSPDLAALRLVTDLGLDSLTLMEIVLLAEEILPVSINNEELRHLRTLGDVQTFIDCKLRGLPLPANLTAPAPQPVAHSP